MLIRTPDYYDKFKCIAGECKDTCCAGWQVDVDDASYEYYKTITGDFGDRLHSVMVDGVNCLLYTSSFIAAWISLSRSFIAK